MEEIRNTVLGIIAMLFKLEEMHQGATIELDYANHYYFAYELKINSLKLKNEVTLTDPKAKEKIEDIFNRIAVIIETSN